MEHKIFGFYSDNPEAIEKRFQTGEVLCMVLHKDLTGPSIAQGVSYGYVLTADYNGEERLVVAGGCYKKPVKRFDLPDPEVLRKCGKMKNFMEGIYPAKIMKMKIEEPLSIVLNNTVIGEQLDIFNRTYEIIEVEHENEMFSAIACVYYDPNYKTEGKIIAQWYT